MVKLLPYGKPECYCIQSGRDTTPVVGNCAWQFPVPAFVHRNTEDKHRRWIVSDVEMGARLTPTNGTTRKAALFAAVTWWFDHGKTTEEYLKWAAALRLRGVPACPAPVPLKDSVLAR